MNKRDLIRDLINSLAHDEPMSKVMIMAQAVSFELYNNLFSDWVRKEQRGYHNCKDKDIPQYRDIPCILRADIFIPFRGMMTNFTIPADIIKEANVRNFVSSVKLPQSLTELEQIHSQNGGGEIKLGVPGSIFPFLDKYLETGNVQRAYRSVSATVPSAIINTVKAKMLDFLSYMNREIDLDVDFHDEKIQEHLTNLFKKYIWNEQL